MRGQGVILIALLVTTIILGAAGEALVCTGVVALLGWLLWLRYRGDVRASGDLSDTVRQRERLDVMVGGDLRVVVGVTAATATTVLLYRNAAPSDVGTLRSVFLAVSIVWCVVYLSSLVDWYIVLPRITGQLGFRPCRIEDADRAAMRYPDSWRETTRIWYLHRLATALVVRYGISYAVTLAISGLITFPMGTRFAVIAGLSVLNAYGPFALLPLGRETLHVRVHVGQTVRRLHAERVKRRWRIGPFHISTTEPDRTEMGMVVGDREYVYDVSAEGIQLVPVGAREEGTDPAADPAATEPDVTSAREPTKFARRPVRVSPKRIESIEPCDEEEPFRGCSGGRCSGINWYCVENPESFDQR